jgi:hypothetical protein
MENCTRDLVTYRRGDRLAPLAFPDIIIRVEELSG